MVESGVDVELLGFVDVVVEELFVSVVLPFASVDLWCFLCFLVVVVLPSASVDVEVLVALCVVSLPAVLPDCASGLEVEVELCDEVDCASLCGMELLSLFISLDLFVSAGVL